MIKEAIPIHRPFYSRDGRLITPLLHIATFKGKRNSSKCKALILLKHFSCRFMTAREISELTGINLAYLQQRMAYWWSWRYVNRKRTVPRECEGHLITYKYQIAERGVKFVDYRIPPATHVRYVREINEWITAINEFKKEPLLLIPQMYKENTRLKRNLMSEIV